MTECDRDHYRGCLAGGAIGDALGAPVEFISLASIREGFGASGIQYYASAYGAPGRFTDDTQMTLFTAEGLLRARVRGRMSGLETPVSSAVASAYHDWLLTQGIENFYIDRQNEKGGGLFGLKALHAQRGPGATCVSALQRMVRYGEPASNNSKGCGGVMRVAPLGLYREGDPFQLGCDVAALTHGHPTGQLAAGAFAFMIRDMVEGASLPKAVGDVLTRLQREPDHAETSDALVMAMDLAYRGRDSDKAIAALGEGWVAEEALAIAVYSALVAPDFSSAVRLSVNHDGDSDSTGAITGNLAGLMYGLAAIEDHWLEPLELRAEIQRLADSLYDY